MIMVTTFLLSLKISAAALLAPLTTFAATPGICKTPGFLNFPTWSKYLELNTMAADGKAPGPGRPPSCNPVVNGLNDFWLIGLAAIEILLRVAILVAIIYVLIGGFKYITARGDTGSQTSPNKINQARTTILDALIGLVIAIIATAGISYIAGKFTAS